MILQEKDKSHPVSPLLRPGDIKFGHMIGGLIHALDPRYKRIVHRNLDFAFPDMPRHDLTSLCRNIYGQFGLTLVELIKLAFLTREDLLGVVRVIGQDNLEKAVKPGKGFIFFSAHIGNWEIAHLFTSAYIDMELVLVAKPLKFNSLDHFINRLRSKFGNRILYKKGALHHMARALRDKKGVGLLIDQETRPSEAVEVMFFDKKVNATPSAALLARRYDCPVLPVFCVREEKTGQLLLVVRPPLPMVKTRDAKSDIRINTQKMTDEVEKIVRAYPCQWFWFHKRWKRHYPHLYPEDLARNQRREKKKRAMLRSGPS